MSEVQTPTSFFIKTSNAKSRECLQAHHDNMVNIGERIKEELQMQERTVTWFANKLGCTRMSVYRIFEKQSIDSQQLLQISKILNRNFFAEISEELDNSVTT